MDSKILGYGGEVSPIEIHSVQSGETLSSIPIQSPLMCCTWHPKQYILAYSEETVLTSDGGTHASAKEGIIKLASFFS